MQQLAILWECFAFFIICLFNGIVNVFSAVRPVAKDFSNTLFEVAAAYSLSEWEYAARIGVEDLQEKNKRYSTLSFFASFLKFQEIYYWNNPRNVLTLIVKNIDS